MDEMLSELPTNLDGPREPCPEVRGNDDGLCLNPTRIFPHPSTSSTMSDYFAPTFVYRRKKQHKDSAANFAVPPSNGSKPSDGCYSAISSGAPSLAAEKLVVSLFQQTTEAVGFPAVDPAECGTMAVPSSSGCLQVQLHSVEALTAYGSHFSNPCSVNDNCSSSKSNLDLNSVPLKVDVDDTGECSSSDALVADKASEEISERDICISIFKSQGMLDKDRALDRKTCETSDPFSLKPCTICKCIGSTSRMLICDNCEDGYHISCYNPHITVLPIGEWLCNPCLKKKHKLLSDKSTSSPVNISTQRGENQYSLPEDQLGSLEFMFRDTEPYISNVRIGDDFQANVPDWRGPIYEGCDLIGGPLDMDASNIANIQKKDSKRSVKLSSIGNWIQCRQVVEGIGEDVDGTICAKWRRAPLFEVQTDDWECFRCILWDPAHADCSAPQELETDEVMKQLKYMEMLRPQLAAKRRKMGCLKAQDLSRL